MAARPPTVWPVTPVLAAQQEQAALALPEAVHAYYAGGAGEQVSVAEAEAAWAAVRLRPRVLRDVSHVDTSVQLLGSRLGTPVLVGPTAAHGLAHPAGEAATAAGADAAGSLLVLSMRASLPPDQVATAGPWWCQAYVLRDRDLTRAWVRRAVEAGARAVVLTGDTPYLGARGGPSRLALTGPGSPGQAQDRRPASRSSTSSRAAPGCRSS